MRKTILLLLAILFCMQGFAQKFDSIYVYSKGQVIKSFLRSKVDGIIYSMKDPDGNKSDEYTTQVIYASGEIYKCLLSSIDSITLCRKSGNQVVGEAVDLGLSVKWATINIGASFPEDYGGLYGWADPTGLKTSSKLSDYPSSTPPKDICGSEYDIARAKWGNAWRLPSGKEVEELLEKCKIEWVVYKGVNCMKYTGPNGNSIIVPAAGHRGSPDAAESIGHYGDYWSGSLNVDFPQSACGFGFDESGSDQYSYDRYSGLSVRPVQDFAPESTPVAVDLGLSVKWANYNIGATKPEDYGGLYGWADPKGENQSDNLDEYPSANPPKDICGTEHDIARAQWGGEWRLPSYDEINELIDKCTVVWMSIGGMNGMKFIGPNGNSIFLPASGDRIASKIDDRGSYGCYWTGTADPEDERGAYGLYFTEDGADWYVSYRNGGLSVRPVMK